jgi:putative flippase GtrA
MPSFANALKLLRDLVPELAKFGVVGAIGAVIDLGGASALYSVYHVGPLKAKFISIVTATIVTYVGNRFWTFRHRDNERWFKQILVFLLLNGVGLLIAEAVIAISTYGLGAKSNLAYLIASIVGTGLATIFRYLSYKRWVFLAPASLPAGAGALADDHCPCGRAVDSRTMSSGAGSW